MRIYLCGPMAHIEQFNFPAFHDHTAHLRSLGHEVVNPAEHDDGIEMAPPWTITEEQRQRFMRYDLAQLVTCDAVAVIPGWESSRGAQVEVSTARSCGIPVLDADTLKPLPRENAIDTARRLVYGDRQAVYSHPHDDYTRTGRMWGATLSGWLGEDVPDVPARIACLMMAQVKISRDSHRHGHDNLVDLIGYGECAARCADIEFSQLEDFPRCRSPTNSPP